jgi:hypothetical protein
VVLPADGFRTAKTQKKRPCQPGTIYFGHIFILGSKITTAMEKFMTEYV